MRIAILDDYADAARTLKAYASPAEAPAEDPGDRSPIRR